MANSKLVLPMNGGDGTYSYSKNSTHQRQAANVVKERIDEAIIQKLDVEHLSSTSNTFHLADLGCAVGPNAFYAMQNIIEAVEHKFRIQRPSSKMPEFQVFFNDQASNDFNTLFTTFPTEKKYFSVGVPGSFHDRLFPESSLHFVHSSYALHWLSKLPEELLHKGSPAWNKGRVHYTSAPDEVLNAYAAQFEKDIGNFLSARAKEIAVGGMMVIIMSGIPKGMPHSQVPAGVMYDQLASSLMEMAIEGLISEDQIDSFNLPLYAASPEEMAELVKRNGYFKIERMELTNPTSRLKGPIDMRIWTLHVRAAMEGMFTTNFGAEIIDEMFNRLGKKLTECADLVESSYMEGIQLFAVLKRI